MIENINTNASVNAVTTKKMDATELQKQKSDQQQNMVNRLMARNDTVTISGSYEVNATYSSSLTLQSGQGDGFDLLRGLVVNIFKEQGVDLKIATGESEIDINAISQEEAQALVAEDGYFGVEQTSDRIVDFAVGIAGGDPSRLDAIKEGVEKGFNEALEAFGGTLPDISYSTLDAVMEKLDMWADDNNKVA